MNAASPGRPGQARLVAAGWADIATIAAFLGGAVAAVASVDAAPYWAFVVFAVPHGLADPEPHRPWELLGALMLVPFAGLVAWAATDGGARPVAWAGAIACLLAGIALFDPYLRVPALQWSLAALAAAGAWAIAEAWRTPRAAGRSH